MSGWDDGKIRAFYPETGRIKFVIPDAHTERVSSWKDYISCDWLQYLSQIHCQYCYRLFYRLFCTFSWCLIITSSFVSLCTVFIHFLGNWSTNFLTHTLNSQVTFILTTPTYLFTFFVSPFCAFAHFFFYSPTHSITPSLTHWLIDSLTHSLTPSLTDSLTHSHTHSLTHTHPLPHWLTHPPTHSLTDSLTHWLTHPPTPSLTHSPTHSLTDSLTDSHTHSPIHSLTHTPPYSFTHFHFFFIPTGYCSCNCG